MRYTRKSEWVVNDPMGVSGKFSHTYRPVAVKQIITMTSNLLIVNVIVIFMFPSLSKTAYCTNIVKVNS